MLYKSLSEDQRLAVPILFCLIFIYFYLKYRHDNIPKILLHSNLLLAFASIILFVYEIVKQNEYEKFIDSALYPFRFADIWVAAYTLGAICLLRGCFLHPKYKVKKVPLYYLSALLILIVLCYTAARIIFSK